MSDSPAPIEWRQRHTDPFEARESHHDRRQASIHTGMPGIIVSYDPGTMTATVQPALQGISTEINGTRKAVDISPIYDVPVHFPGGGGFLLTFPVKAGDECWLKFSERSLDNWHQQGGTQLPSDWRMHDINDAVCEVGVRSQPQVPGGGSSTARNAGTPISGSTTQLRTDDGTTVIDLDGPNQTITLKSKDVKIVATNSVTITAPKVDINQP